MRNMRKAASAGRALTFMPIETIRMPLKENYIGKSLSMGCALAPNPAIEP